MKRHHPFYVLATLALATLACTTLTSRLESTPVPQPASTAPATQAPAAGAGDAPLQIAGGPTLGTPRETRIAVSEGEVPFVEQLASEAYTTEELTQVGETFKYTAVLTENVPLLWSYGWCATTREILDQNLANMTFEFFVNDTPVDSAQFEAADGTTPDNLECHWYTVILRDWPTGTTTLLAQVTYLQTINDGMDDYPAGEQRFVYEVTAP